MGNKFEIAVITNDFYRAEKLIESVSDEDIAIFGIYRSYHADRVFDKSNPNLVISNNRCKDRLEPYYEPVTVKYPARQMARLHNIDYLSLRLPIPMLNKIIEYKVNRG